MDVLKLYKTIVFCFSFAMFCVQFRVAVEKLRIPPLIDITEEVTIDSADLPIITICPTNQYNLTALKMYGYTNRNLMLFGSAIFKSKPYYSWGGQVNKTYTEMLADLFPSVIINNDINPKITTKPKTIEEIFVPKYGYCIKVTNYSKEDGVVIQVLIAENEFHVYITDRKQDSFPIFWFDSQHGELVTGLRGVEAWYDVEIRQKSRSNPNIKGLCEEYDTRTFADCVDDKVGEVMMPVLGCNPPYLSAKNQCTRYFVDEDLSKVRKYFTEIGLWNDYLMELVALRPIPPQKLCKPPCLATETHVQLRGTNSPDHPKHGANMAKVNLNFKTIVTKTFKGINYHFYDFIIDSGSSLGLWLGLSVIGLTDIGLRNEYSYGSKLAKQILEIY